MSDQMERVDPVYGNRRVVDLEEIVMELDELGLSVDVIAKTTRSSTNQVSAILINGRVAEGVEEKRLEDDYRRLMQASVREAFKIIQFGHAEQKMRIITSMLTGTGRAVGKEGNPNEDMRTAFAKLISEMTEVDASSAKAIASPVDDSDEITGGTAPRPRLR